MAQETVTVIKVRPRKSIDKNQNIRFTPGKEVEINALMAKNRRLLDQEGYVLKSEYEAGHHEEVNPAEAELQQLRAELAAMKAAQSELKRVPLPETPHVTEAEVHTPPKPKATRRTSPRKAKA